MSLEELPKESLVAMQGSFSKGLFRRLENDQPFAECTRDNIYVLVQERVVEPRIVQTWPLVDPSFGGTASSLRPERTIPTPN